MSKWPSLIRRTRWNLAASARTWLEKRWAPSADDQSVWSAQVSTRPSAPFSAAEQRAPDISLTGPNAALTILITIGGHRYGLQYSGTLIGPWQNHGAVQTGDGSPLQLTAPVSAGVPRRFYRVLIER